MLQQINFTGDPLPPENGLETLDDEKLASFWMGGAISPIRVRTLVTNMFGCLPPETLRAVGEILLRASEIDRKDPPQTYLFVQDITQGKYPHFDDMFPELMININLHAPQRAIVRAVEDLVRSSKEKLGISETRRRDDRIDEYLAVWDMREGWVNGAYDCRSEKQFKKIGRNLRRPVQTVVNQYCSAFRLIFGCDYSPEAWFNGVGMLKFLGWIGGGLSRITSMRPKQNRRPREVPESVLETHRTVDADRVNTTYQSVAGQPHDLPDIDLAIDLQDLISRGWTNSQIIAELQLSSRPETEGLVNYFRDHHQQI
jgi:hypothetical protein